MAEVPDEAKLKTTSKTSKMQRRKDIEALMKKGIVPSDASCEPLVGWMQICQLPAEANLQKKKVFTTKHSPLISFIVLLGLPTMPS